MNCPASRIVMFFRPHPESLRRMIPKRRHVIITARRVFPRVAHCPGLVRLCCLILRHFSSSIKNKTPFGVALEPVPDAIAAAFFRFGGSRSLFRHIPPPVLVIDTLPLYGCIRLPRTRLFYGQCARFPTNLPRVFFHIRDAFIQFFDYTLAPGTRLKRSSRIIFARTSGACVPIIER